MSSDGNGSMPIFDAEGNTIGVGVASEITMFTELRDMIRDEGIDPSVAIGFVTSNVARALKLSTKGHVEAGFDADFVVVDGDFKLNQVWARGQEMVKDGAPIVFGTFEHHR